MVLVRFGTIRGYDAGTNTAAVEIVGYPASLLEDVPVADNIDSALVTGGAHCVLALNEGYNASDACILAIY
jgi:hypothetical protein